ncbi:hypothetical protein CDAR_79021 [Caerostris darwini]|uniref:Uncharacterized protein n=1 Tax=Caerostris darwini TaxID=1538125 RepID=A0AAV4PNZ9_9ARAC|nr:hypothetical protein CDAR_79021 [Caerostris darwini]
MQTHNESKEGKAIYDPATVTQDFVFYWFFKNDKLNNNNMYETRAHQTLQCIVGAVWPLAKQHQISSTSWQTDLAKALVKTARLKLPVDDAFHLNE